MSFSGQVSMALAAVHAWWSTPQADSNRPLSEQPLSTPKKALAVVQGALAACGVNKTTALGTWMLFIGRSVLDQADSRALNDPLLADKDLRTLTRGALLALGSEFPGTAAALAAITAVVNPDKLASPETRAWLKDRVTHLIGVDA